MACHPGPKAAIQTSPNLNHAVNEINFTYCRLWGVNQYKTVKKQEQQYRNVSIWVPKSPVIKPNRDICSSVRLFESISWRIHLYIKFLIVAWKVGTLLVTHGLHFTKLGDVQHSERIILCHLKQLNCCFTTICPPVGSSSRKGTLLSTHWSSLIMWPNCLVTTFSAWSVVGNIFFFLGFTNSFAMKFWPALNIDVGFNPTVSRWYRYGLLVALK